MSAGVEASFDSSLGAAERLGIDRSLICRRAWPFGDQGWSALLAADELTPERTWALLKPGQPWPSAVRRLHRQGRSRWLLDRGAVAWPLDAEPVVAGLGDWLDPGILRLPEPPEELERGRVVGYKPLRRVVTSFAGAHGRPLYFVKHVRSGHAERCAASHRVVEEWWRGQPEFRLAQLVSVGTAPDYLVWRAAAGVPLARATTGRELATTVHAAGRCLASLHGCPSTLTATRSRQSEMRALEAWFQAMRRAIELPSRLDRAFSALHEVARHLPPARAVVSHGDFHDGQILKADQEVTLLDLDTLAMAEPELDVGNFLAHLDLLCIRRSDASAVDFARVALEAYAQGRGPFLSMPRLIWYRAAAALRLVCVHASRPESRSLLPLLASRAMQLTGDLWMEKEEVVS